MTVEQVVDAYAAVGSVRGVEAALGVSETLVRLRLAEAGVVEYPDRRPRKWTRSAPAPDSPHPDAQG